MATSAKISFKTMDYFKFRKFVIDGNRDETSSCSKEVTSLVMCVQTLNLRDDEFDDSDRSRFEEIYSSYKQILQGKRVDSIDVRLKSGWWGEQKSGLSVGKLKASMLQEVLVAKTRDWFSRHGEFCPETEVLMKNIENPGLYVLKHKDKPCFQIIQRCENSIFSQCAELFKTTFDGSVSTAMGSLLIVSLVNDWDFYFMNTPEKRPDVAQIIENDLILKHDSLWPHGLNTTLKIQTAFDISQFRFSCIRHQWPPEKKSKNIKVADINVEHLMASVEQKIINALNTQTTPPKTMANNTSTNKTSEITSPRPTSAKSQPSKPVTITTQNKTPRPSTAQVKSNTEDKSPSPVKSPSRQSFSVSKNSKPLTQGKDHKKLKPSNHEPTPVTTQAFSNSELIVDDKNTNTKTEEMVIQLDKENVDNEKQSDGDPPLKRSNTFTRLDDEQLFEENSK